MRLVHEPVSGGASTLASTVETADSLLEKARGLMFRRSLPPEYALAFRFSTVRRRTIHMLFVFVPLDVVWVVDGTVRHVERLESWHGFASGEADLLLELPAGAADAVEPGDHVRLEAEGG